MNSMFQKLSLTAIVAAAFSTAALALVPSQFQGVWETKEWFGTIARMQVVECAPDGPYCIQVHSLVQGDGLSPGDLFATSLDPRGTDLRSGSMKIPNGPTLPVGLFYVNENQLRLESFGTKEVWERVPQ